MFLPIPNGSHTLVTGQSRDGIRDNTSLIRTLYDPGSRRSFVRPTNILCDSLGQSSSCPAGRRVTIAEAPQKGRCLPSGGLRIRDSSEGSPRVPGDVSQGELTGIILGVVFAVLFVVFALFFWGQRKQIRVIYTVTQRRVIGFEDPSEERRGPDDQPDPGGGPAPPTDGNNGQGGGNDPPNDGGNAESGEANAAVQEAAPAAEAQAPAPIAEPAANLPAPETLAADAPAPGAAAPTAAGQRQGPPPQPVEAAPLIVVGLAPGPGQNRATIAAAAARARAGALEADLAAHSSSSSEAGYP